MLRECKNCGKEFEGTKRANYCSDKCRVQFNRNNSSVTNDTETSDNVTERVTETPEQKLTKTDILFQKDAEERGLGENWLTFSEIKRSPKCDTCKKPFSSHLELLRYCSPHCRREALTT